MQALRQPHEVSAMRVHDDFDAWVAARGPGLLRLAFLLTGDRWDAEDLVQEALSRALPRWEHIVQLEEPDAYVRRMIVNGHTSARRRFRRRELPVDAVDDVELFGPATDATAAADERRRLWSACLALPEGQRTALVLRYYEDLEYAEIADLTGLREPSVRARVSRGLAALRQELGEDDA